MHEGDRDGSFAHRRCHALDVSAPHITYRKNSRQAGFQQMRRSRKRPTGFVQIILREIGSRLDKTFIIELYATIEPARAGNRSRHKKNVSDIVGLDFAGLLFPPLYLFEMIA